MKVPKDIKQTPPGTWRYRHPQTGVLFKGGYGLGRIAAMVREYNTANGLPEIVGLEDKIIEYICQEEPDYCVSTEPPTWAEKAKSFSRAAVDWVASGFVNVSHEQYEERKAICLACPYWRGQDMLGYGACGKCGCAGLKLFLPGQRCPDNPPRWLPIS